MGRGSRTAKMKKRRLARRDEAFKAATSRHESASRASGAYFVGKTEDGLLKETRKVTDLRIRYDKWRVRISFKREDEARLERKEWGDVETILRISDVPRKTVGIDLHIIKAVRMLKHVRENYELEMRGTDELLDLLDALNIQIYEIKKPLDEDIDSLLVSLYTVRENLQKKRAAVKKKVGMGRLEDAIEAFEAAKALPVRNRAPQTMRACSILTSLRDRLGIWRDRQIAGINEFNLQRECSLRVERDLWLHSQLMRLVSRPARAYGFTIIDAKKLRVLKKVRELILEKVDKDSILKFIEEKSDLFKTPGRERKGAEARIAVMHSGKEPKDNRKYDVLIAHYGWLYRYVRAEDKEKALKKVDFLITFVNANKPRYILDELSKDADLYLEPVLVPLEEAVRAFECQDFRTASEQFRLAERSLNRIINPPR